MRIKPSSPDQSNFLANTPIVGAAAGAVALSIVLSACSATGNTSSTASDPTLVTPLVSFKYCGPDEMTKADGRDITKNPNVDRIFAFFVGKGYSREAAAAIDGSSWTESFAGSVPQPEPGESSNVFYLSEPSLSRLDDFAKSTKASPDCLDTQLAFVDGELAKIGGTEAVRTDLMEATTIHQATQLFVGRYLLPLPTSHKRTEDYAATILTLQP